MGRRQQAKSGKGRGPGAVSEAGTQISEFRVAWRYQVLPTSDSLSKMRKQCLSR